MMAMQPGSSKAHSLLHRHSSLKSQECYLFSLSYRVWKGGWGAPVESWAPYVTPSLLTKGQCLSTPLPGPFPTGCSSSAYPHTASYLQGERSTASTWTGDWHFQGSKAMDGQREVKALLCIAGEIPSLFQLEKLSWANLLLQVLHKSISRGRGAAAAPCPSASSQKPSVTPLGQSTGFSGCHFLTLTSGSAEQSGSGGS